MADLFGAPNGIIAQQEYQTQGLQAQKLMGDIAMQPTELGYKQAATRLANAEATDKESNAAAQRQLLELQQDWVSSQRAEAERQQLVEGMKGAGRDATVADLGRDGRVKKVSQADDLEQFANFASGKGYPPTALAKIRGEIATIREHEAIAEYRSSQAESDRFKTQQARLDHLGGVAKAASAGPQQYAQALMDPETAALLPKGMHLLSYEQALPHLEHIYSAAQTTQQQLAAESKLTSEAAQAARAKAAADASAAAADASRARAELTRTYRENIVKNGGERSTAAAEAKAATAEARKAATEARLRREFPPVPLDPTARTYGASYTAADGATRATWMKDPATGKGVWVPLNPTKALKQAAPMVNAEPGGAELDYAPSADDTGD
jgi:colicin import membrane protein